MLQSYFLGLVWLAGLMGWFFWLGLWAGFVSMAQHKAASMARLSYGSTVLLVKGLINRC
jgi:hypothetical protein